MKIVLVVLVLLLVAVKIIAQTITTTTGNVTTVVVGSPISGFVLQEDGFFVLQQDSVSKVLKE